MRVYIHSDSGRQPRFVLPWDYHLSLSSFVYDALADVNAEKSSRLHQTDYDPPFAISGLIQTGPWRAMQDGLSVERGYFTITSPDDDVVTAVSNAAATGELQVGHTTVPVDSTEVESVSPRTSGRFKTLSPIAVGEYPTPDGRVREWYGPSDSMWAARLKESTRARMEHTIGVPEDFTFKVRDVYWVDRTVRRVKDDIEIPSYRCGLELELDEQTSEFLQTRGIGEKTGLGFGCIAPVTDIPEQF